MSSNLDSAVNPSSPVVTPNLESHVRDHLVRPFGTEKALEPLRRVNAAGTHFLSLINEILDLSKIEAGKLELHPESMNLAR